MSHKNPLERKRYNKEYWEKNREKLLARHKVWVEKNKEKQKEYHREYHKNWYKDNKKERQEQIREYSRNHKADNVLRVQRYVQRHREKVVKYREYFDQSVDGKYRQLKFRAKHFAGTPITLEEFTELFRLPCVYCGEDKKTRGIDRVDNKKGYTKENSTPCCKDCNFMKKAMSKTDFLEHINRIYLHSIKIKR